jgi:NAD(P)-dependent dehydrogenase (short-subunit alcohol dehydrogenase family)
MFRALLSILAETFPGNKYHWHQSTDLPDQTGRVHLVTGGNSGIGFEAAKVCVYHRTIDTQGLTLLQCLLRANATVYIAARSADKARKAIADLKEETGREAHFLQLDLASLASVRRAASEFLSFVEFSRYRDVQ